MSELNRAAWRVLKAAMRLHGRISKVGWKPVSEFHNTFREECARYGLSVRQKELAAKRRRHGVVKIFYCEAAQFRSFLKCPKQCSDCKRLERGGPKP